MTEPLWLHTISNHAVISKKELLQWLNVTSTDLRLMVQEGGFPAPRFRGFNANPSSNRRQTLPSSCRWRVGEVRAWLEGSARLKKELETEIGAERSPFVKKWHKHPWGLL